MLKESSEMFTKLQDIVNLHRIVGFIKGIDISRQISAIPFTPEPCGHESGLPDDEISRNRADCIVKYRECPFNKRITSFFSCLLVFVLIMVDVKLLAFFIKMTVDQSLTNYEKSTKWNTKYHQLQEASLANWLQMLRCLIHEYFPYQDCAYYRDE